MHVCYTCTDPVAFKLCIMGITFMPASDNCYIQSYNVNEAAYHIMWLKIHVHAQMYHVKTDLWA